MRSLVLSSIFAALVILSCTNNQHQQIYLLRVDSLIQTLEAGASSFESLDTLKIRQQYKNMTAQLDVIKYDSNISNDQSVTVYHHVRKAYKGFFRQNQAVLNELNYTRSQLQDLKNDIELNKFDDDKIEEYLNKESQAVVNIKEAMDHYYERITVMINTYEELYPRFQHMADSLQKTDAIEK